jgi:adenylosuccinate synthase
LAHAERLRPLVADVPGILHGYIESGQPIMFEGAQGTYLDVDHGTYPYVTSSNTCAANAALGTGVGPGSLGYVLGITKAYTTRVGAGPFPTELHDEQGEILSRRGNEFGATTGRRRRCGWFDAVAARYSARVNGLTAFALTRLDVLDQFETINICTAYRLDGAISTHFPAGAAVLARAQPLYEEHPGWCTDTTAVRRFQELPLQAKAYVRRIEELLEAPVYLVSVGAEREQAIVLKPSL